jgi:hypothetical protein
MKTMILLFACFVVLGSAARSEVDPVAVRVPEATAWIGQRLPFFIELRSPGSFVGTAGFDLPEIPGTTLMKVGNPVVSSQDIDGRSWFVQTHEFALFSQKTGLLEVPAISVRFAGREGFTGPATDIHARASGWKVEIRRPPGTGNLGFLITTESLSVTETWKPQPGPARVGDVFKRTIVQQAQQVSGMALVPAPVAAPDGIDLYPGSAQTRDQFERGDFLGERHDTITFLLARPGTFTLPALTYVWWNPKTEKLQSKTLPAVTFDVSAAAASETSGKTTTVHPVWKWLPALVMMVGVGAWQGRRLAGWGRQCWRTLNPPERITARRLVHACRRNDAAAAHAAWIAWRNMQVPAFQPGPELRSALIGLDRQRFGPGRSISWQGDALALAFSENPAAAKAHFLREPVSTLPLLNPDLPSPHGRSTF